MNKLTMAEAVRVLDSVGRARARSDNSTAAAKQGKAPRPKAGERLVQCMWCEQSAGLSSRESLSMCRPCRSQLARAVDAIVRKPRASGDLGGWTFLSRRGYLR